jgi:hypothetical protein
MVKIFVLIFFLLFTTSAFAEVVAVPPVREAPTNEALEKILEKSSGGEWQNSPPKRETIVKKPYPAPSPTAPYVCPTPAPSPPSAIELYGDATRGFVHNRSNFFLRCWWANSEGGKAGAKPNFEIAPGFIWEGRVAPGGYKWLYIEAVAATGNGMARVGWKTFQVQPCTQPLIFGWYGWAVYVDSGCFPYFTGKLQ